MFTFLRPFYEFMEKRRDERIMHYPFMGGTPFKVTMLTLMYLFFVKKLGPKMMENRKPFELNRVMQAYNLLQVGLNLFLALQFTKYVYDSNYNFSCALVDYSQTKLGYTEVNYVYFYFSLKILDLMDTVFIVLRKRYRQVSFLHLYHHSIMAIVTQILTQFVPGGAYILVGIINCLVHVVMYSYYFLTSIRPELKESLWWKKYITQLQIAQFCILMLHFIRHFFNNSCEYPKVWSGIGIVNNLAFLTLFGNFYLRSYIFKKKPKSI